jgi:hypothetical protein
MVRRDLCYLKLRKNVRLYVCSKFALSSGSERRFRYKSDRNVIQSGASFSAPPMLPKLIPVMVSNTITRQGANISCIEREMNSRGSIYAMAQSTTNGTIGAASATYTHSMRATLPGKVKLVSIIGFNLLIGWIGP